MTRLPLALLTLPHLAPVTSAEPPADKKAAERARLEGTSKATRVHVGRKTVVLAALEWSVTFAGDRWAMVSPEGKAGGTVRLDLSKKPHRLDLVGKGATLFATYAIGKDRLRLCWWPKAEQRQGELDPLRQKPVGVLLEMERPKRDPGPVLDARR
jgi:uncharacterized protein (TIGR03067 family)